MIPTNPNLNPKMIYGYFLTVSKNYQFPSELLTKEGIDLFAAGVAKYTQYTKCSDEFMLNWIKDIEIKQELAEGTLLNILQNGAVEFDFELAHLLEGQVNVSLFPANMPPTFGIKRIKKTVESISKADEFKSKLVSVKKLLELPVEEKKWFAKKIIPNQSLVIIGGTPGSLKTTICLELTMSMSNESLAFGAVPTKYAKVLYIDKENGIASMKRKLEQLLKGRHQSMQDNIDFLDNPEILFEDTSSVMGLQELILKEKYDIVVLDSIKAFTDGEEDSSRDTRKVTRYLKRIIDDTGCTFVLIHHLRKGSSNSSNRDWSFEELRGSGDYAASADVIYMLKKDIDRRKVYMKELKNRFHFEDKKVKHITFTDEQDSITLTLESEREITEPQTAAEKALYELARWGSNKPQFESGEALKALEGKVTRNAYYRAIALGVRQSRLKKVTDGVYAFTKNVNPILTSFSGNLNDENQTDETPDNDSDSLDDVNQTSQTPDNEEFDV